MADIIDAKTNETEVETENTSVVGTDAGTDEGSDAEEVGADFSDGEVEDHAAEAKAKNAEAARRRRETERQRELKEAREQAIIDALGGENPYTHEPMKDSADVEEFLAMKEIAKNGGDPLTDLAGFLKNRERERAKREQEQAESEEWYRNDRLSFAKKHPDVNIDELVNDKEFAMYADGKVGRLSLDEIYEGYQTIVGKAGSQAEKAVTRRAAQAIANSKASPGALSGSSAPTVDFFTADQVRAMSPEEVRKHYTSIRESMKKW